jgi:adenylosuccinate synthase
MKRARAVIGANFGDEGKGLVVDYLCSKGAGSVVRFNGGAQAGHTVVTPGGHRHVFRHFGSGAFMGVPTYLSRFFICNPLAFLKEAEELEQFHLAPAVFAHPQCRVTTFADMLINQEKEDSRGKNRHGSVGLGVHETVNRSQLPHLAIIMADLWNDVDLKPRLREICTKYASFRLGHPLAGDVEPMIEAFCRAARQFASVVHPLGIEQCPDPVFEGAQGLLLDQDNMAYFPHLTRSKTGMHNVRILCQEAGIDYVEIHYVSRTYLTRHGAGRLPGEDSSLRFEDQTNGDHPYQGPLRFAPLDAWTYRCGQDAHEAKGVDGTVSLVLTHCDQLQLNPSGIKTLSLFSYGPTRDDITTEPAGGGALLTHEG